MFSTFDINLVSTIVLDHIHYCPERITKLTEYDRPIRLLHYFYVDETRRIPEKKESILYHDWRDHDNQLVKLPSTP